MPEPKAHLIGCPKRLDSTAADCRCDEVRIPVKDEPVRHPKQFPCLCKEYGQKTRCDFETWPVGLMATPGKSHLFLFLKYEDSTHEVQTIPNEWLPKLTEVLTRAE